MHYKVFAYDISMDYSIKEMSREMHNQYENISY